MNETNCRIGKVRFKNGAVVRVISRDDKGGPESARFAREIVEHASTFAQWKNLAGYVIVVWDVDGCWSAAYRVGLSSPIGTLQVPGYAAEALRQDITTNAAVDWMNNNRR